MAAGASHASSEVEAYVVLNTGTKLPLIGLGTWKSKAGEVAAAVKTALANGYRHIDCAAIYGNEGEIGGALSEVFAAGSLKREDVFVTSKLWNTRHAPVDVLPALKQSLSDLKLAYLDLYLIHWPIGFKNVDGKGFPTNPDGTLQYSMDAFEDTWLELEKAVSAGLVKAIGLSNFNSNQIASILKVATIPPAVLQIESHPYFTQQPLIDFCKSKGIVVTAFSPLGSPDRPWAKAGEPLLLEDEKIIAIGAKYGKSAAQVCLRFQAQRGVVCIPKSVTEARIISNAQIFDFALSADEMVTVSGFNRNWRACCPNVQGPDGNLIPRDRLHPLFPWHLDEEALAKQRV